MKKRVVAALMAMSLVFAAIVPGDLVYAAEQTEALAAEETVSTQMTEIVEQTEETGENDPLTEEVVEETEPTKPAEEKDPLTEEVVEETEPTEPAEEKEPTTEEVVEETEPTEPAEEKGPTTEEKEPTTEEVVEETEPTEPAEEKEPTTEEKEPATEDTVETEAPEAKEPTTEEASEETEKTEKTEDLKYANWGSGQCGDNLTWTYDNGVLTINGTGAMYDYPVYDTPGSPQCMPWYNFKTSITTLNIGGSVTSIGACAFWGCENLTSVTTPASVQSIGFAAFADCRNIQEINIKSGIIGESAFIRCASLKKVTIGAGVKSVGISAFENCNAMEQVHISDVAAWCGINFGGYLANPLQLAKHLYLNGSEVTRLEIPFGVESIGDYAFEYAQSITSVAIPSSVKKLGDYAFYFCNSLQSVELAPSGLLTIGASAFDSCSSLTGISIPSSVNYIGSYAFTWVPIGSAKIEQGVIASHAFEGCGAMAEVSIGKDVKSIGDYAFNNCAGLRSVIGTVRYSGSNAQWRALPIGAHNEDLYAANLICSGSGGAERPDTDNGYIGATAKIGRYEQDNNYSNGAETLEWNILDVQGDKALVISKYVLDFERYYPNLQTAATWENSSLRSWLNGTFMNSAFSEGEKGNIHTTNVPVDDNDVYGISGGAATSDKMFVLSAEEIEQYLEFEEDRMAACTEYAVHRSNDPALRNQVLGTSYWWVRTPGIYNYMAMYAHYTGSLRYDGMAVANTIVGVRPAMWVNLSALDIEARPEAPADKIEEFVTRLYNVCLNRDPDEEGMADWSNRLKGGRESGTTAAYGFIFSAEFQNNNYCNEDFVKQLYRAFMGREYDDGGLNGWISAIESGMTREEVFNGFAQSQEFNNLCAEYGIDLGDAIGVPQYGTVPKGCCVACGKQDGVTAFVTRLYNICLDRDPDSAGLEDWTGNLWQHTKSGKDVSFGFIFSEEFTNKGLNDSDYVEYLYKAFFGRPSDEGGKADWLNRMHREHYSREDVFNGFVGSGEFDTLCKKYGITRDN